MLTSLFSVYFTPQALYNRDGTFLGKELAPPYEII